MKLAKVFSNGMVLQRQKPVYIWGESQPNQMVRAEIQGKSAEVMADETGHFCLKIEPLEASASEMLQVSDGIETMTLEDIAIGEVYIAGGQSNMEFPLRYEKYHEQVMGLDDHELRFFDVPKKFYEEQDSDFDYSAVGRWRRATSEEDLGYFSAVAFYFAKEIREKVGVPVGIIGCNWGGTYSCAWMDQDTVERVGKPWMEKWEKSVEGKDMEQFWAERKADPQSDAGKPCLSPFDQVVLPRTPSMEEIGKAMMDMAQKGLESMSPEALAEQKKALGLDENASLQEMMAKTMEAYRIEYVDARTMPGILYEHMVKQIAPFSARGVLWYQGESDDVPGLQSLYTDMMKGLVSDWRKLWKDEALPFFEVQLPGWRDWMMQTNLDYATIRRCQEEAAKTVDGLYMASIADVGEEHDIHPKDKRTVGHRLALLARKYLYGEDILCEAPRPEGIKREGDTIRIKMAYAKEGLEIAGDSINALSVLENGREISYQALVDGDSLVLRLEEMTEGSLQIRFARDAWYQVNLFSAAGIPAIPFETRC